MGIVSTVLKNVMERRSLQVFAKKNCKRFAKTQSTNKAQMHSASLPSSRACWYCTSVAHLKLPWVLGITQVHQSQLCTCQCHQSRNRAKVSGEQEWMVGRVRRWAGGSWPTGHLYCFVPMHHIQKWPETVPSQTARVVQSNDRSQGVVREVHLPSPHQLFFPHKHYQ